MTKPMSQASGRAVLVTGGAGYIGAHIAKLLSERGFRPIVFDNLSTGHLAAVQWGEFRHGDVRDTRAVRETLDESGAKTVIHLAGLIEVGRSVISPDLFWDHNVGGTASLLRAIRDSGVRRLVFSSSAAVYGAPSDACATSLSEDDAKNPASPYGDTKLACERMIAAHSAAFGYSAIALRYFNAAGADPGGLIGEAHAPETHLIPLAIEAALGRGRLSVFGDDFPTADGACVRDYIHVNDVAAAHLAAVTTDRRDGDFEALNVGTGRGSSVIEVIRAVETAMGRSAPFSIAPRREGDPPRLVADPARAGAALGWAAAASTLENIISTAVRWHSEPRYGPAL